MLGHPVVYEDEEWRWMDSRESVTAAPRACVLCKVAPGPDGHDPCLGEIPGMTAACCGHGLQAGWTVTGDGAVTHLPLLTGDTPNHAGV